MTLSNKEQRKKRFYDVCPKWVWSPESDESKNNSEKLIRIAIPKLNFDLQEFIKATSTNQD